MKFDPPIINRVFSVRARLPKTLENRYHQNLYVGVLAENVDLALEKFRAIYTETGVTVFSVTESCVIHFS